MSRPSSLALLLAALVALPGTAAPPTPAQVTVYRCTDARGHLALRDSPCRSGQTQQVRSMVRPTDPPPRRAPGDRRIGAPAVLPPTRMVYRTPPRPLYECTRPDGARYTSETAEGNPRWVPLWTLGYPVVVGIAPGTGGDAHGRIDRHPGGSVIRVDTGVPEPGMAYGGGHGAVVPGGTWVRDACAPLPAAEACDLLRDRREELDRRWFSALQGDRDAITREQRRIDARLGDECG